MTYSTLVGRGIYVLTYLENQKVTTSNPLFCPKIVVFFIQFSMISECYKYDFFLNDAAVSCMILISCVSKRSARFQLFLIIECKYPDRVAVLEPTNQRIHGRKLHRFHIACRVLPTFVQKRELIFFSLVCLQLFDNSIS